MAQLKNFKSRHMKHRTEKNNIFHFLMIIYLGCGGDAAPWRIFFLSNHNSLWKRPTLFSHLVYITSCTRNKITSLYSHHRSCKKNYMLK